jgi:hypothetical protein
MKLIQTQIALKRNLFFQGNHFYDAKAPLEENTVTAQGSLEPLLDQNLYMISP